MPKVWYTSDLHFGHKNIMKYRTISGVETVEEHDEFLVQRWNETVGPDDTVIVLGDFAMGHRETTLPIAAKLNGLKYLVPGNHDYVWPGEEKRRQDKWTPIYSEYFVICTFQITDVSFGDVRATVSHMPYKGEGRPPKEGDTESFDSRYQEFALEDEGGWLVHGHVHDAWRQKGRQINVGVDVWDFAPVDVEVLTSMMEIHDRSAELQV